MTKLGSLPRRWPTGWPLRPITESRWAAQRPTYHDAQPTLIDAALKRAEARPSGNWYVFAASEQVRAERPFGATIAGREVVAWRTSDGQLVVGPGACPHLGAPLRLGTVDCDALVCRWHGLRVRATGGNGWRPLPSYDDGVLVWVRLDTIGGEAPTATPVRTERPSTPARLDAVSTMVGTCEPSDVLANRLDPWHGSWFHPYSFTQLDVLAAPRSPDVAEPDDRFLVAVTFRVVGWLGVPVRAEFHCPEPRTVVMRIVDGEGVGSVVETHATPLGTGDDGHPRTMVIEAVIAGSTRRGFSLASAAAPLLRPLIRRASARLWRDDLAYAQRRYRVRQCRPSGGFR